MFAIQWVEAEAAGVTSGVIHLEALPRFRMDLARLLAVAAQEGTLRPDAKTPRAFCGNRQGEDRRRKWCLKKLVVGPLLDSLHSPSSWDLPACRFSSGASERVTTG